MDERVEAVPFITIKDEINLARYFLPPAPDETTKKTWKELSQPRPDACLGYITKSDASKAVGKCEAPFTANEELTLNTFCLTQYLYFPFLTFQWKVPNSNDNLHSAQNQAARDGAVIVNYLYDLYTVAYGCTPSALETCHFSLQSDVEYMQLWVHWRDGVDHYMEIVDDCSLRKTEDVFEMRGYLRNIVRYALEDRLQPIRAALPLFARNKASGRYPGVPASDSGTTVSEASHIFKFQTPLTPSSVVSDPIKKRRRLSADGASLDADGGLSERT